MDLVGLDVTKLGAEDVVGEAEGPALGVPLGTVDGTADTVGSVEGEDDCARLGDSDEHTPSIQTDPSRHSSSQAGATAKNRSSTSSHSPEAQSLTEPC